MTVELKDDIAELSILQADGNAPAYSFHTTNTTGATVTWAPNTWGTGDYLSVSSNNISPHQSGKLTLQGENADIEINGESLLGMMKRIEQRLDILVTDPKLESEWTELRELGDQYRALEQQIRDKMATWQRLTARDQDNN
jgi:hypothetical protein